MFKLVLFVMSASLLAWTGGNAQARSKRKPQGPLAPLAKVAATLQRAGKLALEGKRKMGKQVSLAVRPRTRTRMQQAGVKRLQLVGFEFELVFQKKGVATYYLRSFVHASRTEVALMALSGRSPRSGRLYVTGAAPSRFQGLAKPFRLAARRLVKSAPTKRCRLLPVVSNRTVRRLGVKGRVATRLLRGVSRAKSNRAGVCRALHAVRTHSLSIRIDDVAFVALDGRGRLVGLLKADLRLRGKTLQLKLRGFRAVRP